MAKNGKKVKRRSKQKNAVVSSNLEERKLRLARLLDNAVKERSSPVAEVVSVGEIKDQSLSRVVEKLGGGSLQEDTTSKPGGNEALNEDNEEKASDESEESANQSVPVSNRQKRIANKPSIAVLKAAVQYPELIEWFDCDAQWPFFNAALKTAHNAVGVPRHWQSKRGYLSGRSVMDKAPFELPDIIKQTDIETMRETVPQGTDSGKQKLKDITRARVQPKLGTLDLDYKRLYDAFFTLGKNWKPPMLPFGDLYYENRNIDSELEWTKIKNSCRPGYLSATLRSALDLTEGMLPPWCYEMSKIGLPKSYPDMKICGVNWDISHLTISQYGYWPGDNHNIKKQKLFGALISFEDFEGANSLENPQLVYESDSDRDDNGEPEPTEPVSFHEPSDSSPKAEDTALAVIDNDPAAGHHYDATRPLFTVLKESKLSQTESSKITGSGLSYELSEKRIHRSEDEEDHAKRQRLEEEPDFRF